MHALVKKDILSILTSASKALKQSNITTLRQLSDQTLHNANIYQDPEAITILSALITSSLAPEI